MLKHASWPQRQRQQRGAVMILFGLTMVVLIGFAGLAIDLGRFFVIKTELQNAMDACALSAASQLRPGLNTAADLTRAVAYGRVFTTGGTTGTEVFKNSIRNKANFQSTTVNLADSDVTFAKTETFNAPTYAPASTVDKDYRYARCELPLGNLPIYFMRVLNLLGATFTTQTVSAMAVAKGGAQLCNIVPAGICQRSGSSSSPPHGLNVGEWISIGTSIAPGKFGWVDYSASAGGSNEVKVLLTADGQCKLPAVGTYAPESGQKTSAEDAWNTRFGIYSNPFQINSIGNWRPDKTGYAYFGEAIGAITNPNRLIPNWPRLDTATEPKAYDGIPPATTPTITPAVTNYVNSVSALRQYEQQTSIFSGSPDISTAGTGGDYDIEGRLGRRVVVAPVIDCGTMHITGYACALMLNPFGQVTGVGGGPVYAKLEYLGKIGTAITPCGSGTVVAPNLSVLVK